MVSLSGTHSDTIRQGCLHYHHRIVTPCFIDKTPFFVDFIFIYFNYYLTLEYETN